jgi:hypothetical protein
MRVVFTRHFYVFLRVYFYIICNKRLEFFPQIITVQLTSNDMCLDIIRIYHRDAEAQRYI